MSFSKKEPSGVAARLRQVVNDKAGGKCAIFSLMAGIPNSTFQGYMAGRSPRCDHLKRIHDTFSDEMTVLMRLDDDDEALWLGYHCGRRWYYVYHSPVRIPVIGWLDLFEAATYLDAVKA